MEKVHVFFTDNIFGMFPDYVKLVGIECSCADTHHRSQSPPFVIYHRPGQGRHLDV